MLLLLSNCTAVSFSLFAVNPTLFVSSKTYLKKRLDNFDQIILERVPDDIPVMLLMDNINMYRGNKRHHRLFKTLGPKMWNFTVRGVIIPNCDDIRQLLSNPQDAHETIIIRGPETIIIFKGGRPFYWYVQ